MAAHVLVAYSSRYGSTEEVAEAIGATLTEAGLNVDVRSVTEVRKANSFDAFVVGGPLYMFHWQRKVRRFVARQRSVLSRKPVAVFAMGPLNDEEEEWSGAREQFRKALAPYTWLSPVATAVFGGAFDPVRLTFPHTIIRPLTRMPASDIRDWDAIRQWARDLVPLFSGSNG